ncbi:MAG TPA: glycosyltransferase, partial [Burkholderiales bacterium]|nr:glycosyltransferase [Burkholderiales bacterium]
MKVLMTADAVGGVWTYALDLSAALAARDISIVLATMGPRPSDSQRAAVAKLANVELVTSDYRLEWMDDPWSDVAAAGDWLLGLAARAHVDLIHLNGYSHAALPWARPIVVVAHSCVYSWWQAVHEEPPPAEWIIYRRNVTRGLNGADHVIAPTQAFLDQLHSCYEVTRPASVIRNGHATDADDASSRRLPIVFSCCRLWDEAKNIRTLDAAAESSLWRVYAAGPTQGPEEQSFVASHLVSLGALPAQEVAAWMRQASIFAHPA